MRSIFTGLVLLTFDFAFLSTFDLLPDFVGYYFLYRGLSELETHSHWFRALCSWSVGMIVASMVVFFLEGIPVLLEGAPLFLRIVLNAGMTAALLYLLYGIVRGVGDMETTQERYLRGDKLYRMWGMRVATSVLSVVFSLLWPLWALAGILGFVSGIAAICFLYSFYQTRKLYIHGDTPQNPA